MRFIVTVLVSGLVAMLTVPSGVQAQKAPERSATPAAGTGESKDFLMKGAQDNQAEVELGWLARERASNDAVKEFADRMVADHGKAHEELVALARQKGVTVPSDIGAQHKSLKSRLEKLSGDAFDRAYVTEVLKDHKKDVADFRREAERSHDADVKAWTAKTLPTLEQHLKSVEDLARKLKVS